jgi:hypothetical protein
MCLCVLLVGALFEGSPAWAWAWPAEGAVLREFSVGTDTYAAGQHRGVDIALGESRAVLAPAAGEVSFAGQVPTNGLTVTIVTTDGHKASLTHLGALRVRKGAMVAEGDPIADPGPTGEAEHQVPYLHLGIRVGDDETYVDPLSLLPPRGAPNPPPAPAAPPAPTPPPATAPPPAAEQPAPPSATPEPTPTAPTPVTSSPPEAAPGVGGTEAPEIASSASAEAPAGAARPRAPISPTSARHGLRAAEPPAPRSVVEPGAAVVHASPSGVHSAVDEVSTLVVEPRLHDRPVAVDSTRVGVRPRSAAVGTEGLTNGADGSHTVVNGAEGDGTRPRVLATLPAVSGLLFLLMLGGAALCAHRLARRPLPIIGARERGTTTEEDPGSGRMAICERPSAHRPCRGLRRPIGHLRPLSPASRERRAHGQWDRRARHAGHGGRGRSGRVTA